MTSTAYSTVSSEHYSVPVDFEFSDAEREDLTEALLEIQVNPYRLYPAFIDQVQQLIDSGRVPARFMDFAWNLESRDRIENPVLYVKNSPVDADVPVFDHSKPVESKYQLKNTFVGEGFLALFALLRGTPGIGYVNVNDGDVFQDIYPKESMSSTQSQKALKEIHFHKDLANHFVRPDHVYMLGMRSTPENEVYTSFVRNKDIYDTFSEDELEYLRSPNFYTPFDDLTVKGGSLELGDADVHPILSGEADVRYFENRTKALESEGTRLIDKLDHALHAKKQRLLVCPGDFVCVYNNYVVHAKEVVQVRDPEALKSRWIIKTVNVDSLAYHSRHMVSGTNYLVNG